MATAYDLARDIADEMEQREGLIEADCDEEGCGSPYLTNAGRDWLIARLEQAFREFAKE